ncbi:hypothetical protein [Pediococcus argentinicus]|nr:hypothetical protein LSA03_03710 [Pediococcus argentinicus]
MKIAAKINTVAGMIKNTNEIIGRQKPIKARIMPIMLLDGICLMRIR